MPHVMKVHGAGREFLRGSDSVEVEEGQGSFPKVIFELMWC